MFKVKKYRGHEFRKMLKSKNSRSILSSKRVTCGNKKSKFIKKLDLADLADLADMQLISKYNKGIRFLLCVIDIFSKYAWVVPLKNKKGVTNVNGFKAILRSSKTKPNKIWVYQGSELYNNSFKKMVR